MSDKEEEFPFEDFLQALSSNGNLKKDIKHILQAICSKNIYWAYSTISTIIEILKSKDQEPPVKCRALETVGMLLQTCEYPVLVFVQLYVTPILLELANFRAKKSQELLSYYFQQTQRSEDTQQTKRCSVEYVLRGVELIYCAANIKPFRTVQTEQLKQQSYLTKAVASIRQKRIEEPKKMKYCNQAKEKQLRKLYIDKLRKFQQYSQEWTQFLLVNLLEEVQQNKKDLLELRLLLPYGQSFLTSAVINFCQEELLDISQNIDYKKKYLGMLNQLIRSGDIQAIIMVKNSQFVPTILAHISKFPGEKGLNAGQNIYPEVKATKQVKRQFYTDFLRCLETWAMCMPQDYDSDDFNIKIIYNYLKKEKKFKFPENMLLTRYQKEINQNLQRNKERNERLLELLQNMEGSKQQSMSHTVKQKMSNVLQKTTILAPSQLQLKLQEIKKALKELIVDQESADKSFKLLVQFKDNWITYLQSLDFDGADEDRLQTLVINGQKSVEQIQLVVPIHANLERGKMSFKQYRKKIIQTLQFHNDVSCNSLMNKSNLDKSKSFKVSKVSKLAQSKMNRSKMANSKMGKSLLDKIKAKSKIGDKTRMNMSKAMDRSNMLEKSKYLDKSRNNVMDTSTKRMVEKREDSKTLNFKKIEKKLSSSESSSSETQNYKLQELKTQKNLQQKLSTPHKYKKPNDELQTSKKDTNKDKKPLKISDDEEDQKVIRVADYEVEAQPKRRQQKNKLSSSRQKSRDSGSRILLRRNNNSRLDRSRQSQSRISVGRRSTSSRKPKQNSLYKKSEQDKTKKISEVSTPNEQRMKQKQKVSSNKILPLEDPHYEQFPLKKKDNFDQFHKEDEQISSIHSNSVIRVSNKSKEKSIKPNNQISEINYSRQIVNVRDRKQQVVEFVTKDFEVMPLVGDYYQEPQKKPKAKDIQTLKKRPLKDDSRSLDRSDGPQFKKIFQKNNQYMDKNDFKLMKKKQFGQTYHPKVETPREERHTAKQVVSAKELEGGYSKSSRNSIKQTDHVKSVSSSKFFELKSIEEQKSKEIQNLRKKINDLEKESVTMKKKLAAKDSELKSIKSGSQAGSERGFAHFTVASASNYQKSSLRSSSASKRVEMTQFQKEVESGYKQYLQRIKGNTFKKSLLKLKCLVHRTDQIQIGCLSQRCDGMIESTLYVTPHRYDMIDFSISVIHDHRLRIKVSPQSVKLIPSLKQQKIHLVIQVLNIPFCLPQCEINYKADSEYCSNYNRLTLPLGFNKFVSIKPLDLALKNQRHIDYIKTDNFKINTKVVKLEKILDSFPAFTFIPAGKGREQMMLGASCQFGDSVFNVVLNVSEKWSWWQGFLLRGESKPMNFLICTFKEMIDGSKK